MKWGLDFVGLIKPAIQHGGAKGRLEGFPAKGKVCHLTLTVIK